LGRHRLAETVRVEKSGHGAENGDGKDRAIARLPPEEGGERLRIALASDRPEVRSSGFRDVDEHVLLGPRNADCGDALAGQAGAAAGLSACGGMFSTRGGGETASPCSASAGTAATTALTDGIVFLRSSFWMTGLN